VVARSSAEAEYQGMAQGVCKLLWIKQVFQDLGIDYEMPMSLHCDNKTAMKLLIILFNMIVPNMLKSSDIS